MVRYMAESIKHYDPLYRNLRIHKSLSCKEEKKKINTVYYKMNFVTVIYYYINYAVNGQRYRPWENGIISNLNFL